MKTLHKLITASFLLLVIASVMKQSSAQTIAGGEHHSLAVCNDSTVRAWGYNGYGQLGNGTNTDSNVPVQVSGLTSISAIAGDYVHSLALKNDCTIWSWGNNSWGQLGNGTNTGSYVPVQVTGLCQIAIALNEIAEPLDVSVYPNPTTGKVAVAVAGSSIHTIEIYNVLGEKVYHSLVNGHLLLGNSPMTIDLSAQPGGIYFIQLQTDKVILTGKIIKL